MKRKQQRTLELIFARPVSANVRWADIEALFRALISFDPDMQMFRGEFVGLNGGADFYAVDVEGLKHEGEVSLCVFLEVCARRGIEPRKHFDLYD